MNDRPTPDRIASPPAEQDAAGRLADVNGAVELHTALLALLLPPGSERAVQAWARECPATTDAEELRRHVAGLTAASRLPWFDLLLSRMATQPIDNRRALLQATRRVMNSRGFARPIDRLHWLAMRHALGSSPPSDRRLEGHADVTFWLESDVIAIADVTAFLGRMVPAGTTDGDVDDDGAGSRWYAAVVAHWTQHGTHPPWQPVEAETLVTALERLQLMSWMQRPIVTSLWVSTAQAQTLGGHLSDLSADAIRLSCRLLDSPIPPRLARQYITLRA